MKLSVRKALENEDRVLTEISYSSKGYWNYPEEYFEIWRDELTITKDYIRNNIVYVAEQDCKIIGYFSIVKVKKDFWAGQVYVKRGFWLEHLFIHRNYIRKGIVTFEYRRKNSFVISDEYLSGSRVNGRNISLIESVNNSV